jgi:pyrimidine-nucleoside phosphorylase
MIDIISKKKFGEELTKEEIEYFINGYINEAIPDYQVSALLMAIYFKGLSKLETKDLTMAMAYSGDVIDLSKIEGIKVDKHSTGGVGDTTTLIVAPLVAACGAKVAKMSGRGLGHTGGTLDKFETINGFKIYQQKENFIKIVNSINISVVGQSGDLVPADKKLYALRDVTATVDNISLIASSIMSKKIAAGADTIILDVKTGSGAFMKTLKESVKLAKEMVDIGSLAGRKTIALVTDMNQPLGKAVGNALEVKEAIEILNGLHLQSDLTKLCIKLGAYMLIAGGIVKNEKEGERQITNALISGRGKQKLKELIEAQGGDANVVDNTDLLPKADKVIELKTQKSGYINKINTENLGLCAMLLGAGRMKKEDSIDLGVGFVMNKRLGDKVSKNDVIAFLHINDKRNLDKVKELFTNSIGIDNEKKINNKLIYKIIT